MSPGEIFIVEEPVRYSAAWALQSLLHQECGQNLRMGTVLILEHEPVYTLGRSAQPSHWGGDQESLCERGADLHAVNRGGSVTYHGPGQIVVYPLVRLVRHAAGPRQWVWLMEEVLLRVLRGWRIDGFRIAKQPGMWVLSPHRAKIASVGVRIDRGVTLHGFALNVDLDLSPFQRIQPCGMADCQMTSMAALLQDPPSLLSVKRALATELCNVLSVGWPIRECRSLSTLFQRDQAQAARA